MQTNDTTEFASYRNPAVNARYHAYLTTLSDESCPFCDRKHEVIESTATMNVIKNDYPYEVYEGQTVTNHLMIVPKRHILYLDEFDTAEHEEFFQLIAKYDSAGYNISERAQQNLNRSVAHNHTHLIQLAS